MTITIFPNHIPKQYCQQSGTKCCYRYWEPMLPDLDMEIELFFSKMNIQLYKLQQANPDCDNRAE